MSVESSREAFLRALETLLSAPDAPAPGVNAVARQAGLNKVLVYRYFGSWDGLLESFARRVNPWRDLRLAVDQGLAQDRWPSLGALLKWLFRSYLDALFSSPLLQNLLRLSLTERGPLQLALERDREEEGQALAARVTRTFPGFPAPDPLALTALLTGGVTWLVLAGTRAGIFNGLTFAGPGADALPRLRAALDVWIDALTASPDRPIL